MKAMSTKLSIQEALKRVHLNTVTLRNEEFTRFRDALQTHIKPRVQITNFSERVHENHVRDFLLDAFYKGEHGVGKKDENNTDLCIFAENSEDSPAQVLIECKNPKADNSEMINDNHLNRTGFHEVITYYLDELSRGNYEVKYLVVTNSYDWFIFEALMIRELIATNELLEKYKAVKKPSLWKVHAKKFYKEEVAPAVERVLDRLVYTGFSLDSSTGSSGLKSICKLLSPYFLLKQPYNDKYALNERFYNELLYIIGLEETKQNGRPVITRRAADRRDQASLLENTLHQLSDFPRFTSLNEEGRLDLALELVLMWVNRLLFIKLVESQLMGFHKDSSKYRFFTNANIKDYNDLNELFFQVLAHKEDDRSASIKKAFTDIPYLNSRLFELSQIEADFFRISSLKVDKMKYFERTVLAKDARESPRVDNIKYIVDFLNNYDFGAESKDQLAFDREEKELINASVLGKIFEKINGYKDGAVFTPATITQFICQQTLERAVVEKFQENGWPCSDILELKELITREKRQEANRIMDSIRVLDPAVGSGHFLVSALNRLIEIKYRLGILLDADGVPVKGTVRIIDDELVVRDEEGARYAYKHKEFDPNCLQVTLFREKRTIIENCLFGVDINPNSVNICQLRLWIELLKNAYYDADNRLVTLPNIDINIKCGDSMVHQKGLHDDLRSEMAKSRMSIEEYKQLVDCYKNTHNKAERKQIEQRLNQLKKNILYISRAGDELYRKLSKEQATWNDQTENMFSVAEDKKEKLREKLDKMQKRIDRLNQQIAEREEMYRQALEWRFAFPEVLDQEGRFVGFDCMVGNPPYIAIAKLREGTKKALEKGRYKSFNSTGDICMLFYEYGMELLKPNGLLMFITSNTWLRSESGRGTREYMAGNADPLMLIDFKDAQLFDKVTVATNILMARKCKNRHKTLACEINTYNKKMDLSTFIADKLVENSYDAENPWVVLSEADQNIIARVSDACRKEEDNTPTTLGTMGYQIYSGFKTGLNDVFCIEEESEVKRLIAEDAKSSELIVDMVRGEDLKKFAFTNHIWLLNIHNGLKEEKLARIDINEYPAVKRRLDNEKIYTKLKKREDQGDTPYNLRNCAYLREFAKPKIIWGELSDKPKFALDKEGRYYCLNTVFFFTGERLEYLLCYLNSSVCEYIFSKRCTTSGTGTMRWLKYTVERIMIPQLTEAQEESIVRLYHEYEKTAEENILKEINALFYQYIGLKEEDIRVVENSIK